MNERRPPPKARPPPRGRFGRLAARTGVLAAGTRVVALVVVVLALIVVVLVLALVVVLVVVLGHEVHADGFGVVRVLGLVAVPLDVLGAGRSRGRGRRGRWGPGALEPWASATTPIHAVRPNAAGTVISRSAFRIEIRYPSQP
jgi:hypothetical protein